MNAEEKTKKTGKSPKKILISIGSIFILVLAAISFIFIPAMAQGGGNKIPPFGKYNGKPIEYTPDSKMAYYMELYADQYKQQGREINDSTYYSILSNAFNSAALNMAFTDEVESSGYVVSEKAVDREMIPYFYDSTGKYSPRIFKETPDTQKIALRKNINENLIHNRYVNDVLGEEANQSVQTKTNLYGLKKSSKEIEFIKKISGTQRSFNMAFFSLDNYPLTEVAKYVKDNADLFSKYNLSVINADTKDEATSILNKIKNNEVTFEDAVKELSTKTYSADDGKLFSDYKYELKNILETADDIEKIDALAANDYSEIIQFKNGYGFIRCDGEITIANENDEELLNDVLAYIKSNEAGKIEDYFIANAKDLATAATSDGLTKAANTFGAEVAEIPAFPINYGNNQLMGTVPSDIVSQISGAQYNEEFLKTAFSLKAKEISEPMVVGSNIIVLQLDEEITSADADGDTLSFMYPYYVTQFDQNAVNRFFMTSEKFENNLFDVYFNKVLKK